MKSRTLLLCSSTMYTEFYIISTYDTYCCCLTLVNILCRFVLCTSRSCSWVLLHCTAEQATDVLGYVTINSGSTTTSTNHLRMMILKLKKKNTLLAPMKILSLHKIGRGKKAAGMDNNDDNIGQYSVGLLQTSKVIVSEVRNVVVSKCTTRTTQ